MACEIDGKIKTISRTEYIGNSLSIINDNFETLRSEICNQESTLVDISLSAANFNTQILSLSSTTIPGAARAWTKFDGARDTRNQPSTLNGDRFLYRQFNIKSVYRKGAGDYRVTFFQPLPNTAYGVVGTSSDTNSFVMPYYFTPEFFDIKITRQVDPRHFSVVIF